MSRSKWKGPYINNENKKKIFCRSSKIIPKFLDRIIQVHNGKTYSDLSITIDMMNHKLGEFIFTRSKFLFKKNK